MSNQAKDFLEQISPYLRVKKRHAQVAIDFQNERCGLTGSKPPSPEQIARREQYRQEIHKLNH